MLESGFRKSNRPLERQINEWTQIDVRIKRDLQAIQDKLKIARKNECVNCELLSRQLDLLNQQLLAKMSHIKQLTKDKQALKTRQNHRIENSSFEFKKLARHKKSTASAQNLRTVYKRQKDKEPDSFSTRIQP